MAQPRNPAKKAEILKRIEAHQASVESNKGAFHSYLGKENAIKRNVKLVHDTHTERGEGGMGRTGGGGCGGLGPWTLLAHSGLCVRMLRVGPEVSWESLVHQ